MRRRMPMLAGCSLIVLAMIGALMGAAHAATLVRRAGKAHAAQAPVLPASRTPPPSIALASGWSYAPDPRNTGLREHWAEGGASKVHWTPVSMPNDFNALVSNTGYAGTIGWYRLVFKGPPALLERSWDVSFQEVRRHATVWLNGRELGASSFSYAPFSFPAAGLKARATNVLTVRVDNIAQRNSLPQDWWNWGGIVQPVSLVPTGRITLSSLGVMPELACNFDCGSLLVQANLQNVSRTALAPQIKVATTSPSGTRSTFTYHAPRLSPGHSQSVSFKVPVQGKPDLWSPVRPALYGVVVSTDAGGRVEQVDRLKTGMRSVSTKDGILYLNGRRLWLHGAAIQEDMDGHGAALTSGDIRTIVSELKAVGANVTRAHYLLSQPLLDALDAAGIMVWEQPPVDHADPLLRSASGRTKALSALQATVLGYRSHPSVIVDSVGNELSPTPETTPGTLSYLEQAIPLARKLDPIAPVGLDIYCYPGYPPQAIYRKLDVIGISDYYGWYTGTPGHSIADFDGLEPFLAQTHASNPNQALVISEFGAEALYDGPVTTKGTYEFQGNYLRETFGVLNQLSYMNGAIYWTLREFAVNPGWVGGAVLPPDDPPSGLHHKGLIAYDGTKKPAFAVAQQLFAQTPGFVDQAAALRRELDRDHVAVRHHVVAALDPKRAPVARAGVAPGVDELRPWNDLSTDEPALDVGVDQPGGVPHR